MSQIRLVLADRDTIFLEKFSAYLLKNKTSSFSLELFSSEIKLEEWLKRGEKADIIAISMALYNDLAEKPERKNLIILRDCPESMLPEGMASIFKYRSANFLMKEILSLSAEQIPQNINGEKESSNVNLVVYADGSDVLNPFAQGLACIKAEEGHKTLYFSLDEIPNTDSYFTGNNPRGLSEMLYFVKSNKDNLSLKAEACSNLDMGTGVYFFKGHHNPSDIANLTESELSSLIKSINNKSMYDEIIITRGFFYDSLLPVLIRASSRIYIISLNYCTSAIRIKMISSYLTEYENESKLKLKDRVVFCVTNISSGNDIEELKSINYDLFYLSSPLNGNNTAFPTAEKYLSEIRALSGKSEEKFSTGAEQEPLCQKLVQL